MESIYTQLALYGSKNECARTENVFSPYPRSAMVRLPLLCPGNHKQFVFSLLVLFLLQAIRISPDFNKKMLTQMKH